MTALDVAHVRKRFPALARRIGDHPAAYLDGPAGTQVPVEVLDAVRDYLAHNNANSGGSFVTSRETDALVAEARQAVADLLGAAEPETIVFGPNMTTLTFALSRALGRTWGAGDEVVVTRLDHDANVTPWVLAARDAGARVQHVDVRTDDGTLDLEDLGRKLSPRTRLVAVGAASNALGTINPVARIAEMTHAVGARLFVDAVHYAPHGPIDVGQWGCDYLACSAYKFFGPHLGILWGRRKMLEECEPYKLRVVDDRIPHRWASGTESFEGIAGTRAAIDYLATLGREAAPSSASRREALLAAYRTLGDHERRLSLQLLEELQGDDAIRIHGIADPGRIAERAPTFGLTHARCKPAEVAEHLARRGVFVWHGNFYALAVTEALGLEPDGLVRVGFVHYNTTAEVDRLVDGLRSLP